MAAQAAEGTQQLAAGFRVPWMFLAAESHRGVPARLSHPQAATKEVFSEQIDRRVA